MLALLAAHLAGMGAFLTVPVLSPLIAAETGLPLSLVGFHTALVYGGTLVSAPMTAGLIRRYGGVRVLQGALLLLGLAIALSAIGTPAALLGSALLAGVGHGPITPGGSHLIAARTPPGRRALVFSLKQTGVPAGAMVVAAITPPIAALAGWRMAVLAMALVAVLVALAIQPLRRPLDADRDPAAGRAGPLGVLREAFGAVALLKHAKALRHLTVMSCGYGIAQFCFLTFFVAFQVATLGTPLAEAALRMAAGQVMGVIGRIIWALLADRFGGGPILALCGAGGAVAALALALAGPDWPGVLVLLAAMVMGATAVGWNGVMLAEAARIAPGGQVGAATSATSFCFGLTMLVAPPLFSGLVVLTGGYAAGFAMCAAACVLGAAAIARSPAK
jgi:predicted MFS family arabinose efflux permease